MSKEELIKKYCENENKIQNLRNKNSDILKELASLFEHKLGEIIKYRKTERRNLGTFIKPKYEDVPGEEITAVLTAIKPSIWMWPKGEPSFHYKLEFKALKKDGGISKNNTYVNEDNIEWTGEIHEDYKNKDV